MGASNLALQLAKFNDQSDVAHERLSLDEQRLAVQQSSAIEAAAFRRAQFTKQYRQNISAATAITHLSELDTTSPTFLRERAKVIAKFPDALPSPALQKFLDSQDQEHKAVQTSIRARAAATFTGPASDVWTKAYDSSGNMEVANKLAEAEQGNLTRAQKLAVDPHLDPVLKSQIFDAKTGQFSTDPSLLAKAEVNAGAKAAAAKSGTDAAIHISNINNALKTMQDVPTGLTPDAIAALTPGDKARYDSRFNLEQALKNMSYTAAQASTPATATPVSEGAQPASTADDEVKRLLGQ